MTKTRELTPFERGEIVGLYKGSHNITNISKTLDIPRSTVNDVIVKWKKDGLTSSSPRPGRPPIMNDRDQWHLNRLIRDDRQQSVEDLTKKFKEMGLKSVSTATIRRNLYELGYHGRAGVRKPFVSEQNRLKRLSWCKERKNWEKEWENVVWSDESRYLLFQNDSNHWVWRKPKEKYDVDCLLPTVKQGSPGIMVWGAFISNKIGPLVIIRENINAKKYLEILQEHLLPFFVSLGNENEYIFQDDNAPVHRANIVTDWKNENSINFFPWPAQSPDLNPIEHVWDFLERQVRKRDPRPKSTEELILALQEEWVKIDSNFLETLVSSMPRRVRAVIKSKGYPTKY